jgi:sulfur carrier protein ThiS
MDKRKIDDQEKLKELLEIVELNKTGYAGVLPNGNIVDRRKHPNAIPIQENRMFGVVKPKPIKK